MFRAPFRESMIRLAKEKGLVKISLRDIRKYTEHKHHKCDDKPFGGGAGMVMTVQPVVDAVEAIKKKKPKALTVLLSPRGEVFTQKMAWELANAKQLILVCGHYEGLDERVSELVIDRQVSIGDFITTGGEIPAMCIVDSLIRLVPGVVGNAESIQHESFSAPLLEYPQYTRPRVYRGLEVPDVLLSGNHSRIERWRQEQSLIRTRQSRPDLYKKYIKSL